MKLCISNYSGSLALLPMIYSLRASFAVVRLISVVKSVKTKYTHCLSQRTIVTSIVFIIVSKEIIIVPARIDNIITIACTLYRLNRDFHSNDDARANQFY